MHIIRLFPRPNHNRSELDTSSHSASCSASSLHSDDSIMMMTCHYAAGKAPTSSNHSGDNSSRSSFTSRIRRIQQKAASKKAGTTPSSKFDAMAKEEQRHLADEIKTCKNYVRNLQTSNKFRTSKRTRKESHLSIGEILAKKHATELSEEISLCEQELKVEGSFHSNIDCSCSRHRQRLHTTKTTTGSFRTTGDLLHRSDSPPIHQQKAPTAA